LLKSKLNYLHLNKVVTFINTAPLRLGLKRSLNLLLALSIFFINLITKTSHLKVCAVFNWFLPPELVPLQRFAASRHGNSSVLVYVVPLKQNSFIKCTVPRGPKFGQSPRCPDLQLILWDMMRIRNILFCPALFVALAGSERRLYTVRTV
jgi:hypothetical protein